MTTAIPDEVAWGTARPEENSAFVGFVDACFGLPAGTSLRRTFPTALAPVNANHHYVGCIDGEIVCAASALVRPWRVGGHWIDVACLGCFSTAPLWRGRGLSTHLQEWMLEKLAGERVAWAALWTDRPDLYARRGFESCGREAHGRLDVVRWPTAGPGEVVRRATPDDAAAVLGLYEEHDLRARRTIDDVREHLDGTTSRTWVLERAGSMVAYASLGKGADFPGYVHDYAGEVHAVHCLWGTAVTAGAAAVLVPVGADHYVAGVAREMPGEVRSAAMVRPMEGAPRPQETEFAVWGFDSA